MRCQEQMLLRLCTKIWPPDIDPALGRSTYVKLDSRSTSTANTFHRSSRLLSSRRPMTLSAPTSSNSSPRTSNSLFLTAYPRPQARRSSPESDLQLSTRRMGDDCWDWGGYQMDGVALHLGKGVFYLCLLSHIMSSNA